MADGTYWLSHKDNTNSTTSNKLQPTTFPSVIFVFMLYGFNEDLFQVFTIKIFTKEPNTHS